MSVPNKRDGGVEPRQIKGSADLGDRRERPASADRRCKLPLSSGVLNVAHRLRLKTNKRFACFVPLR
jgi:hypothetical protein